MKKLREKRPSALCPINDVSAEHCKLAESLVSEINEPSSIKEAWHNEYGKQWMIATDSEFESLIEANNWELVPGVAPRIFRQGADSSNEGAKIWLSGYCKCQKSLTNSFSPSDGGLACSNRGAIAPSSPPPGPPLISTITEK